MQGQDVLFSSASIEWGTPQHIFDALDAEFHFTLDAAANVHNHKCDKWYGTQSDGTFIDGLAQDWSGETIWLNPPYQRNVIDKWAHKAYTSARDNGTTVVLLLPARLDVKWWNKYCVYAPEIRFVEGRIRFEQEGKYNSATFPSAIVIFRGGVSDVPYQCVKLWKQPKYTCVTQWKQPKGMMV
ncbi:DNA N-6-adenine-methyltransferase [Alicyclobacillus acidoterrestris]|uniref:Phage N-6-adenine-methyltransferase n=1 Tax=Alicyclobacillus acidoterrestris (strain ATCC 49025 / DSM 3922 / CIP 106132 / NCIMB 13137 / GD3B) TaxID=1356854 RepID=T0DD98_ALIAG|nr:DNA N-6-adenine-methyltransferase [Alicyclobacillus acidoterrestris]EPZ47611.1 DNA N-6-adenine-methyltransferase [Alicyclobacillus acidoterrestris ATCC 49025]UNO47967.1 phage N-6-adenine-methyltransferase [Alicyclobacillus acidoterrestris]